MIVVTDSDLSLKGTPITWCSMAQVYKWLAEECDSLPPLRCMFHKWWSGRRGRRFWAVTVDVCEGPGDESQGVTEMRTVRNCDTPHSVLC